MHALFWIHGLCIIKRSSFNRTNSSIVYNTDCCCNILHCMPKYSSSDTESIFQVCKGPMVTLRSVCTHNVTAVIMQLCITSRLQCHAHLTHLSYVRHIKSIQIKKECYLVPSARTNLVNSEGKVLGIAGLGRNIDQPSEEVEAN